MALIQHPGRPPGTTRPEDSTGLNPVPKGPEPAPPPEPPAPVEKVRPLKRPPQLHLFREAGENNHACSKCKLHEGTPAKFNVDGIYWTDQGKPVYGMPEHQPEGGWIVVVGDCPDDLVEQTGDLTHAVSVQELTSLLKQNFAHLLPRIWFTVSVGCRSHNPPDDRGKVKGASDKQIGHCSGFLKNRLERLRPVAVLPMGAGACQAVLGRKDVMLMASRFYQIEVGAPSQPTRVVHISEPYDVYIGRDFRYQVEGDGGEGDEVYLKGEGWGSPFIIGQDGDRATCVKKFEQWFPAQRALLDRLYEIKGKRIACHCHRPGGPKLRCHGEYLAKRADLLPSQETYRVPVFPLWAIGYARGEDWQWKQYINKWRQAVAFIENQSDPEAQEERDLHRHVKYRLATTFAEVEAWFAPILDHLDQPLAWDTETTGVAPWRKTFKVFLFSFRHACQPEVLLIPVDWQQFPEIFHEDGGLHSRQERGKVLALLKLIMEEGQIRKIGHNLKFDQNGVRARFGWKVKGFLVDTQLLEYCIDPNTLGFRGVDDLCRSYYPEFGPYWETLAKYKEQHPVTATHNYSHFPVEIMLPYAACDTDVLLRLYDLMLQKLVNMTASRHGGWFVRAGAGIDPLVTRPATPTLTIGEYARYGRRVHHLMACEIEQNGLAVDREMIDQLHAHYSKVEEEVGTQLLANDQIIDFERHHLINHLAKGPKADWIRKVAFQIIPDLKPRTPLKKFKDQVLASDQHPSINWGSVGQVRAFFVTHLGLPIIKKTDGGDASTDEDSLGAWAYGHDCEPARLLLEHREYSKFLKSYLNPLRSTDEDRILHDDGMIHADFKVAGPVTGRLATSNPNVQAFPREGLVKRLYTSRFKNGWILQRDYSGLEVRVLALFSREPALLEAFRSGGDPHFRTQQHFFQEAADKSNKPQRAVCKRCLFGRIYGQGDQGLLEILRKERVLSPATGLPITLEECAEFNQTIDALYPQVCEWVQLAHAQAIQKFFTCSAFGFTVPLQPMTHYARWKRNKAKGVYDRELSSQIGAALRHSQNYCIQSTASDITTFAAYRIAQIMRRRKLRALLVLVVHDAIYVDCPQEEVLEVSAIMHDVMDNLPLWIGEVLPGYDPSWIDIPIIGEAEIGLNAKDALAAKTEPSMDNLGDGRDLVMAVPSYKPDDARNEMVTRFFGDSTAVNWLDDQEAVEAFLHQQKYIFK